MRVEGLLVHLRSTSLLLDIGDICGGCLKVELGGGAVVLEPRVKTRVVGKLPMFVRVAVRGLSFKVFLSEVKLPKPLLSHKVH